ncbi:hypothetical protein POL68_24615 [Stigmatella sp. ncwal1]|uniref:Uncharacterized protein n=1 Tax=Stigmatella ashevillensis TaxID=2995309 RepID=A0ABT5DDC4_9BACT|nr:hypothetical protein [Stigmatella ashevillena]MDC0711674.1 hypothetical protein [Stigmatella ashevillena]
MASLDAESLDRKALAPEGFVDLPVDHELRKSGPSRNAHSYRGIPMSIHDIILATQGLLGRTLNAAQSPQDKEFLKVAAAALRFISETGAVYPFEDYLQLSQEAPPYAAASFAAREAAETWLQQHPEPPHGAFVLISDDYHIVMYVRELNDRRLFPHPVLQSYLAQLTPKAPSGSEHSFDTLENGIAWLHAQPESLPRVYLSIAGIPHVALYHRNLHHYALYPLPKAKLE